MAAQDPDAPTDSNGGALVATCVVMLVLTYLSIFLRSYVRAYLTNGFQADDWLILAAQANFTISCAFILRGVYYGLGRHNKSLDQFDEIQGLKWQALATATYITNMWLIKLSIGIFLLRLAVEKRYRYILWASIAVVGVWSLVLFFWNLFQCDPVDAQWDYTVLLKNPDAHCASADEIVNAAYALSIMTILSDWLYALLPVPMIWKVKMTTQAKATVVMVLGMGVFASIATLIRLKFLADLENMSDILHAGTDAMVWTLIEPGVAIIAASLATIRPLLRRWRVKGFATTENSRKTGPFSYGHPSSRTNRSHNHNKMPGFGSADVTTVVELELGRTRRTTSLIPEFGTTTTIKSHPYPQRSRLSQLQQLSRADEVKNDNNDNNTTNDEDGDDDDVNSKSRRIEIRTSEMYIIEGASPHHHSTSPTPTPLDDVHVHVHVHGAWLSNERISENGGSAIELNRNDSVNDNNDDDTRLTPYKPTYQR
ncbi:hypothetical protein F4778DRAFT_48271 [Xylariomycetidae sp. FL2044]|nr:hypothetical protein F4778DRAFT_48271 [Xylariomycetidae sp. FL2044]